MISDLRSYIAELKRMQAEGQRLLDQLNNRTPEGVDLEARAESLRDLNIAAEVDSRVISALEEINRTQDFTTMLQRLGYVLHWIGSGIAAIAFGLAILAVTFVEDEARWIFGGGLIATAVVAWLVGRSCRYIFAGD